MEIPTIKTKRGRAGMNKALADQKQMHLPESHRCYGCESCLGVSAWNFDFLGCYHKPYKGKWIKEIKDCPKDGENG